MAEMRPEGDTIYSLPLEGACPELYRIGEDESR